MSNLTLEDLANHCLNSEEEFSRVLDDLLKRGCGGKAKVPVSEIVTKLNLDRGSQKDLAIRHFSNLVREEIPSLVYPFLYLDQNDCWVASNIRYLVESRNHKYGLLVALAKVMLGEFNTSELVEAREGLRRAKQLLKEIEADEDIKKIEEFFEMSPLCEYDDFSQISIVEHLLKRKNKEEQPG